MKALLDFDEKEFWIQLFSIVARREARIEEEDIGYWLSAIDYSKRASGELRRVRTFHFTQYLVSRAACKISSEPNSHRETYQWPLPAMD
jgi:hypothetical protein